MRAFVDVVAPPWESQSDRGEGANLCRSIFYETNCTWNPNRAPCFGWRVDLVLGGLTFKNRGHWGSRYSVKSLKISTT